MPLKFDLQTAAITLPLDAVLELVRGATMAEDLEALMKLEIVSCLCAIPGLEDEVIDSLMREAFGAD